MTQALAQTASTALGPVVAAARDYAAASKSTATRRAYRGAWAAFERWCASRGLGAMPAAPDTLAVYVADLAQQGRKIAGIEVALAAISQAHKALGHESPRSSAPVRAVVQGIRRTHGV